MDKIEKALKKDNYLTIKELTESDFRDRGSKFLGYVFPVQSIKQIEHNLSSLKEKHPKARHICYAYRMGPYDNSFRMNDDGEPSGTAGRPIFQAIQSSGYHCILVAVVRYFGGTKLGVAGLINAYKTCAAVAIGKSSGIRVYLKDVLKITFEIKKLGLLYKILKDKGIDNIKTDFTSKPTMEIEVRKNNTRETMKYLVARYHGIAPDELGEHFESDSLKFNIMPCD